MKVIAIIDNDNMGKSYSTSKVLVEATTDELENVRGNYSHYNSSKSIKVGSIIKVSAIYENAKKVLDYYKNFKEMICEFGDKAKFLKKLLDTKNLEEEV